MSFSVDTDAFVTILLFWRVFLSRMTEINNTMSSDDKNTCCLCKTNLLIKGVITNSRVLFSSKNSKERPLSECFQDSGVVLLCLPGVYFGRICLQCFQPHVRITDSKIILKQWQSEHNEKYTNNDGSRREEKKDSDMPTKIPQKKKLCKSINLASCISTTEVN